MASRVVKSDAQGLYCLVNRRKYRPQVPSNYVKGDTLTNYGSNWGASRVPHQITFYKYGAGSENWTTNDPYIPPKRRAVKPKPAKPGENQVGISKNYRGCQVAITVAENKAKHAGRVWAVPLAMSMNATAAMSWDEWDALVKEINDIREDLPIRGIVAQLQEEVALDDELQNYIKEKGLA